ncbi:MAG: threonine/serine dehydratase [Candidatus Aminicenantes bacterium]|nr:threonine/serine dehydratase [Candidatus Aminicenantes bacterium]
MIDVTKEVLEAEERIRKHIVETPLIASSFLGSKKNCRVFLKLENLQRTFSFKFRGAANKILSLDQEVLSRGVVTASSGNHGAAFAALVGQRNLRGVLFLPKSASETKVDTLRGFNVELRFHGEDCLETEIFARRYASENGLAYIPPYNDPKTIGGQGTIGIELDRQMKECDVVYVPVGGGGLISGLAGYLKSVRPLVHIIGCQPENSAVMYESIKAGKILSIPSKPTLSDGTAGGIELGSVTFDFCRRYVDDFILVNEEEIKNAVKLMIDKHSLLIEGAAALSVASFLKDRSDLTGNTVALIITGSKISLPDLQKILSFGKRT